MLTTMITLHRVMILMITTIFSIPRVYVVFTALLPFRGIIMIFIPTCFFTPLIRCFSEPVSILDPVGGFLARVGTFGGVRLGWLRLGVGHHVGVVHLGDGVPHGVGVARVGDRLGDGVIRLPVAVIGTFIAGTTISLIETP